MYIYIFQDEKCRLMRNLSLSMVKDSIYNRFTTVPFNLYLINDVKVVVVFLD